MNQILNFFISNASAAESAAVPVGQSSMSFLVMFIVFFAFMYFGIWRPQNKRAKEQQNLLNSLAKGDEIMTAGGILGRISKIHDRYITLEIAPNAEIVMQKSSVVTVLPKGTLKSID